MTKIKIFDLQNCVELCDDEAQAINGGSKLSVWLKKHLGIPEVPPKGDDKPIPIGTF